MKTEQEIMRRLDSLRDQADEWPTSTELLEWVLSAPDVKHIGSHSDRCDHKADGWFNKEAVFARKWAETNRPPPFLNSGIGPLEHLVTMRPIPSDSRVIFGSGYERYRDLTQAEATAAASVIQWLGTNCGWCWLEECIRECGFDLIFRRDKKP